LKARAARSVNPAAAGLMESFGCAGLLGEYLGRVSPARRSPLG